MGCVRTCVGATAASATSAGSPTPVARTAWVSDHACPPIGATGPLCWNVLHSIMLVNCKSSGQMRKYMSRCSYSYSFQHRMWTLEKLFMTCDDVSNRFLEIDGCIVMLKFIICIFVLFKNSFKQCVYWEMEHTWVKRNWPHLKVLLCVNNIITLLFFVSL